MQPQPRRWERAISDETEKSSLPVERGAGARWLCGALAMVVCGLRALFAWVGGGLCDSCSGRSDSTSQLFVAGVGVVVAFSTVEACSFRPRPVRTRRLLALATLVLFVLWILALQRI